MEFGAKANANHAGAAQLSRPARMRQHGGARGRREGLREVLRERGPLHDRLQLLREFGSRVRSAEYHLTSACNLRCAGCWFFEYDYDRRIRDESSVDAWRRFARRQADQENVRAALLIGGEPTLHPERIAAFVESMDFVTISSNGLRALPREGLERVAVALTLFGGGPLDDALRGVHPSGERFEGLFEAALRNYRGDPRATFIYALSADGLRYIDETVQRIEENGNLVTFNYYSRYGSDEPLHRSAETALLDAALRVQAAHPDTVVCHPYYIRALITGCTDWGTFGYDVCPSISTAHPDHKQRLKNGNPVLPGFNSFAADARTLNFCCTSGHCEGCRDSQAVYSWLLVNLPKFAASTEAVRTWVEVAESYWRQFVWSPYHPSARGPGRSESPE